MPSLGIKTTILRGKKQHLTNRSSADTTSFQYSAHRVAQNAVIRAFDVEYLNIVLNLNAELCISSCRTRCRNEPHAWSIS